jgi:hypothetical protein
MTEQEEKRRELINELLRTQESLIARAVESAPLCHFRNGQLLLFYQDPLFAAWVKVLTDPTEKARLLAAARQLGIEVHIIL